MWFLHLEVWPGCMSWNKVEVDFSLLSTMRHYGTCQKIKRWWSFPLILELWYELSIFKGHLDEQLYSVICGCISFLRESEMDCLHNFNMWCVTLVCTKNVISLIFEESSMKCSVSVLKFPFSERWLKYSLEFHVLLLFSDCKSLKDEQVASGKIITPLLQCLISL